MTLVSVIIPTHNRANLIPRAIRSVLSQTFGDLECIVVDDCSEDDTLGEIARFKDTRIRVVKRTESGGASAARNAGILGAKGNLIAFLDDDDEWMPEKLNRQVGLIQSLPRTFGMVYCWMDYVAPDGRVVGERHPSLRGEIFAEVLPSQPIGNCSSLLARREVIDKIGTFDETLVRGNDGDFIRRVCKHYLVDYVPEPLVAVHIGHVYARLSALDEAGRKNAIHGEMAKLEKFADILPQYPRETSIILAKIGSHYAALGNWRRSLQYFLQGARTDPLSLQVYRFLGRSMRFAVNRRSRQELDE